LFVIGMILARARVRTGALWFSIGLHAGWILAFKSFNMIYQSVPTHPLRPWGVGDSLRSGLVPLLALGLTAVICHLVLKRFETTRTLG
jgi:membrane protease YdiL (CAAX protease family)